MFRRIFFFLFVIPSIAFAQNDTVLTYQKVVEAALKNNFDIQIARNNSAIAANQNTYGNAGFLPRVDLNASMNAASNNTKQEFSSGLVVDKNNVASNNINSGVFLSWTIFDGLKMFTTKEKLDQLEQEGQLSLKIQIENTIESVTLAYFQIVKQQQLIRGIEAAKVVSEERIKIAEKKLSIGSGSNVELLQAKLDLNEQRSDLLTQKTILNEFKSNLLALLKTDPFTSISVDSVFSFDAIRSVDDIKQSIEKTNNSLLLAKKDILVSNQFIKELRAQRLPKLALNANYLFGRNENAAGFALLNQNLGYNLGFTFSWNLFNGFNTNHQIKTAELQLENTSLESENLKYVLFSSASASYYKWLGDKEILTLEEDNIKLAEESLKITTERLKLGLGNYIETKESQKSYEDAITRLVNARFNLKSSETELKKLTGELIK
jgi:outer membrane protein